MMRKVVISNGRKYLVTVPGGVDNEGVGPGSPIGSFWMVSFSGSWFQVSAQFSSSATAVYVSQSVLTYQSNDLGIQLISCNDSHSYYCYLTGNPPTVTFVVSQSAYTGSDQPKPNILLHSITDNNFYLMDLKNVGGTISTNFNPNPYSASMVYGLGY